MVLSEVNLNAAISLLLFPCRSKSAISFFAGYGADSVQSLNVPTMINSNYEATGELASLWEAKESTFRIANMGDLTESDIDLLLLQTASFLKK
tara:strand:+ start:1336 stop:1614 length:279 start_codon:yes stop_codon:yes gene_type:complete